MSSRLEKFETVFLLVPVGALLLFYVVFACAVPVNWPYYEPVMEEATIEDHAQFLMPRANLSPTATFPLIDGVYLVARMGCQPLQKEGSQDCSISFRFFNPENAAIEFKQQPFSARSPDGEDLIDKEYYRKFADRFAGYDWWPEVREDGLVMDYDDLVFIDLKGSIPSDRIISTIPEVIVNGTTVSAPEIEFIRRSNITCVGLFSNY